MIIGGAEDKKDDCQILSWFVDKTKEIDGKIVVLTTATTSPDKVGEEYRKIFESLGAEEVEILKIENRLDAFRENNAKKLLIADGIYFTGGDQLRITSILGGTLVAKALYRAFDHGTLVAGTSAGAAIMSETMIVEGEDDESPRRCTVKMAPGLGLLKKVVVDMHFSQRGRHGRLLAAIGQNPNIMGIGIDEDTAIVVHANQKLEVLGSRTVWIVDGRKISYSNVSEQAPDEVLVLADVRLHVLSWGYGYDLENGILYTSDDDIGLFKERKGESSE